MKKYTVNEIRTTLYPLVLDIFTDEFKQKYENNIKRYEPIVADLMIKDREQVNSFVKQLALCIGSPASANQLIKKYSAKYIVLLFMRYHLLTQYLIHENQNKDILLPETSNEFFIYLFNEFFFEILSK